MSKDKRHRTVRLLIEHTDIKSFNEIFGHIPVTVVARAIGTNYTRMTNLIKKVRNLKLSDIEQLSNYFEVEEKIMLELIYNQLHEEQQKKKPKSKAN